MMMKNEYTIRFFKNFTSLFLLNNLAYVFSFLTLPILISKYGLEKLGIIFTIQSIMFSIALIANYNLVYYLPTQSKLISSNPKLLLKLWNLTISIRLFLSIIISLAITVIIYYSYTNHLNIWLLSLVILLPKVINPTLFFNALEKNKTVLKIGFFTKLLFLLLIYFSDNLMFINLFLGLSELIVTIIFLIPFKVFNLRIIPFKDVLFFMKKHFNLFLVNLFSLLKPASIIPSISYFLGNEFVTIYTLAEKIMNVIRGVSGTIFVSLFPIYNKEKLKLKIISLSGFVFILTLTSIFAFLIWVLSPYLIYFLNNFSKNDIATKTLQILSLSIPMYFLIIPLFSYFLEHKKWNLILLIAFLQLVVLAGLILNFHQSIIQIAIAFVISEYVLLIGYFIYIIRIKKIKNQ